MKRLGTGLLCAVIVYPLAVALSYFLVLELSPNMQDRDLEAAMTSVFFYGPAAAVLAFVVGVVRPSREATK